jgi:hypothetical protein
MNLTPQQIEHAKQNLEKLIQAKKLEIDSYKKLQDYAAARVIQVIMDDLNWPDGDSLRDAFVNLFASRVHRGLIELEELELNLKGFQHMSSSVIRPSGVRFG